MQRWAHGHCRVRVAPSSLIGGIRAEETVVFCEGFGESLLQPATNVPDMCPFGEQASAVNLQESPKFGEGLKMLGHIVFPID